MLIKLIVALAAAVALTLPATATAEWAFTRYGAQKVARDAVYKRYDVVRSSIKPYCWPQHKRSWPPATGKFHGWNCEWSASGSADIGGGLCTGRMLIFGEPRRGGYGYTVLRGIRCAGD